MRRWTNVFAILWITAVSIALLYNLNNTPLWQDEAESALNALTISLKSPIPKGAFDGEQGLLHEMACYYKTDDPKYEYLPTHFMYTPYVTIHGWIPYYFIRAGMEIFGKNTFGPRFFSVVFFALSLTVFYLMLLYRLPSRWALCIVAYCSLMPTFLDYAMQTRWYSYALFFSICGLFSFWRFIETKSKIVFTAWVVFEVMLYYTYISGFIVHQITFILFLVISKRDCLKSFLAYGSLLFLALLPHVVITKFPLLAIKIPARHVIDLYSLLLMGWTMEFNPFLVLSAITFALDFVVRTLETKHWKQAGSTWRFDFLCLLFVLVGYFIFSFTSPVTSFYPRVFIILIPFIVYFCFCILLSDPGDRKSIVFLKKFTFVFIIVFLLTNPLMQAGSSKIPDLLSKKFKPDHGYITDASWVLDVIKHIESSGVQNPLVLTSFEHYVFRYYSNLDAELIWPIRKEFIDNTDRHLFIVLEKDNALFLHCKIFLPEQGQTCQNLHAMKFYDRIQGCKETNISGIRIFDCPPVGFNYD